MTDSWFRMKVAGAAGLFILFIAASAPAQKYSRFHEHPAEEQALIQTLSRKAKRDRTEAIAWAKKRGLPLREKRGNRIIELMRIYNGTPLYYTTLNKNAAISTAADKVRNTAPYNLSGAGITVGVWDGGWARATHQEFGTRVTVKDSDASSNGVDDHATHVSGTIGAEGVVADAKGMAPSVKINSYGWDNDLTEMASAAASAPGLAGKIYLSNHSYGLLDPSTLFGQYMTDTRTLDQIVSGHQYYLPCIAAGNEQSQTGNGYGTISYFGIAKNGLTVGAVRDAVSGTARSLANATMTGFSSWGPAKDGRIKPDIVANGYEVKSTLSGSDTSYGQTGWSGTSMACPNACGSAALLVEYYKTLFPGGAMRASSLKGLIIHTADDLGPAGPDYKFGWGLMNTLAAARLLEEYANGAALRMTEASLSAGHPNDSYTFQWNGVDPIRVTLCWTDPEGVAGDDTDPDLVNDLNLQLTGPGGTFYPFKLDKNSPTSLATATGTNNIDNVEQVYIASPTAGAYTVTVNYAGSLTGSSQWYSLLVNGDSGDLDGDGMPDFWESLYFSSSTGAVATADLDGDGADNLTEYIAGTLPNNAASVFKISAYEVPSTSGAPFVVTWNPVAGRVYDVKWSDNLQYSIFSTISGNLPYPVNSYTDSVGRTGLNQFYRVDVSLQ